MTPQNKYRFFDLYRIDVPGGIGLTAKINGDGEFIQGICSIMDFGKIAFVKKLKGFF